LPDFFAGLNRRRIVTSAGLGLNLVTGGNGPPLLLLHGYPETHLCWHKVAPQLARRFTLVIPDLRGYGESDKPPGGGDHSAYSKRAMAQDMIEVMDALGFSRFGVAGHDRGGRVAHRLALDHPAAVEKLAILDIAPTATMYANTDKVFATAYYHWFFLIQPFDLPERLIGAEADYYLRHKISHWGRTPGAFSEDVITEYVRCFSDPAAIHASCEDYRAAASIDLVHDEAGERLSAPLLALWGAKGFVGRNYDVLAAWRDKSDGPVTGEALPCGHFLPEEAPGETAVALAAFFA
jgi:haloacetate dehalogenase